MKLFKYENNEKLITDKLEKKISQSSGNTDKNIENWDSNDKINSLCDIEVDIKDLVKKEMKRDEQIFQWNKIKVLLFSYIGILILSFMRGSLYFKSIIGIET